MIVFYYNYKKFIQNIINSALKDIYDINNPPKIFKSKLSINNEEINSNSIKKNNKIKKDT